jgi:hypothetical protein
MPFTKDELDFIYRQLVEMPVRTYWKNSELIGSILNKIEVWREPIADADSQD